MKLIMIRHLKTPGNEKRQYIGRTDEALSEKAIQQFQGGCGTEVEQLIASPMKRCIQTAELIYPAKKIQTEERLRECDFGLFEGKTYEDLKENPDYIAWLESGGTTAFPKGEEQKQFRSRCVQGMKLQIDRLIEEGAASAAFVVHGGTIMAVLEQMAEPVNGVKQEFYHWQVKNGEGYQFEVNEDEWKKGKQMFHKVQKLS